MTDMFADPVPTCDECGASTGRDGFTHPANSCSRAPGQQQPIASLWPPMIPSLNGPGVVSLEDYAVQKGLAQRRITEAVDAAWRIEKFGQPVPLKFRTNVEIDALPQPVPLVAGWLNRGTLARMFGASGDGKSFVALDLAACIATGRPWHGVPTTQATVVYVVAEGASEIGKRRQAWERQHGGACPQIIWLTAPVQTVGPQWGEFVSACRGMDAELVILDTQARVTVGVDENDNSAMGLVVAALDQLKTDTGACVMLVHHSGHDGARSRGASSVFAALDTELQVVKRKGTAHITVSVTKQKDGAPADPRKFLLTPSGDSAVLLAEGAEMLADDGTVIAAPAPLAPTKEEITNQRTMIVVEILREHAAEGDGLTKSEVCRHFKDRLMTADPDTKANTAVKALDAPWSRLQKLGRLEAPVTAGRVRFAELDGLPALDPHPDAVERERNQRASLEAKRLTPRRGEVT